MVLPAYELPPPPALLVVPHAASTRAASSPKMTRSRFMDLHPPFDARLQGTAVLNVPNGEGSCLEAFHQARDVQLRVRVLGIHLLEGLDQDSGHRPVPVVLVVEIG